ncbi:hypothetical protein BUE76_13615 [Cnuella takakiae]|nr:hypothetical protein BUE76_13615 [Cnuella takakiae]
MEARHPADSLVRLQVTYHTNKLDALEIVWGLNDWNEPESQLLPAGTKVRDEMAFTPMERKGGVFVAELNLPQGAQLNFYFRAEFNKALSSYRAYDTNEGDLYAIKVGGKALYSIRDKNLGIYAQGFNLLYLAGKILLMALILFSVLYFVNRYKVQPAPVHLFLGAWLSGWLFTMAARAQITHTSLLKPKSFLAALQQDALLLFILGFAGTLLLALTARKIKWQKAVSYLLFALLFFISLVSILNIEVIKQLGTPFNYKWLYYSDFLKESDSKKQAAQVLDGLYIGRLAMLMVAFVLLSKSIQYLAALIPARKLQVFTWVGYLLVLAITLPIFSRHHIAPSRKETPVWAFARSFFEPANLNRIQEMKLPGAVTNYFSDATAARVWQQPGGIDSINNIIVFVSESTPANLVSLYTNEFDATPKLKAWSRFGRVYDNMYVHIPSTGNSMISLVTGVYPMIDYNSALNNGTVWEQSALPTVLNKAGWQTGLFFASDLRYSEMDSFAHRQGFGTIRDRNNMPCKVLAQRKDSTLDVMDDACVVHEYLGWLEGNKGKKNMAVVWTNQTHSPYYSDGKKKFTDKKGSVNQYLNALHHSDSLFGQLMNTLAQSGKLQSTLVVFAADHGEAFGTHDQRSHASRIYEENVRIPLVLIQPRLFRGERDSVIRSMVDLPATIAQVCGLPKPKGWYGKSLFEPLPDSRSFFVSPYTDLLVGTRNGKWKFIYNVDNKDAELYDLQKDPAEKYNLSGRYPEVVKEQSQYVFGWMQQVQKDYSRMVPNNQNNATLQQAAR